MPDDEVQIGDIVSGMWPPKCGQCCDAKLVQIIIGEASLIA